MPEVVTAPHEVKTTDSQFWYAEVSFVPPVLRGPARPQDVPSGSDSRETANRRGASPEPVLSFKIMASRSVNKVILIGHLGRDAETAYTASQTAVTKFSVATNRRWKDQQTGDWKEETNWTNVVLWRSENLAPYLTKGKQVYVEGRLQTRSYDDKDGKKVWVTEVVAEDVILLGGGRGEGPAPGMDESFSQEQPGMRSAPRGRPAPAAAPMTPSNDGITDDDVPF
jgi:single-strand DNA-binding protein